jgi:hypothetical protein
MVCTGTDKPARKGVATLDVKPSKASRDPDRTSTESTREEDKGPTVATINIKLTDPQGKELTKDDLMGNFALITFVDDWGNDEAVDRLVDATHASGHPCAETQRLRLYHHIPHRLIYVAYEWRR